MPVAVRGLIAAIALCAVPGLSAGSALAAAPAEPVVAGQVTNATTLSDAVATAVSGNYAYTTAYNPGRLTVVDISNPTTPKVVGWTTTHTTELENGSNVAIAGHYAYVVSKNRNTTDGLSNDDGSGNSLTIVDISNPASPTVVGSVRDPHHLFGAYGIAVQGNYAYVAYQGQLSGQPATPDTSTGGFTVVNISNPASPTIVGNLDNGSLPSSQANDLQHSTSVALSGHFAYVTAFYHSSVTVIDIANPASPAIVTSLHSNAALPAPADLAISGTQLYVANQWNVNQFATINIANPAAPAVEGIVSNPALTQAYRIRARGSFAYLAARKGAVGAIDVSDPNHPRLAGSLVSATQLSNATGLDLDAAGRHLAVSTANTTGGITMVTLDPSSLSVAFTQKPGNPSFSGVASFALDPSDAVSTLRCSLDGAVPAVCTDQAPVSFTGLKPGKDTFSIQIVDADGSTATQRYTWAIESKPRLSGKPALSRGASVGLRIRSKASWTGYPALSFRYQWLRCNRHAQHCTAISRATHSTYTPTVKDLGSRLEFKERARNSLGTTTVTSRASAAVTLSVKGNLAPAKLTLTVADPVPGATLRRLAVTLPHGVTINGHRTVKVAVHARRHKLTLRYTLTGAVNAQHGLALTVSYVDSSGARVRVPLVVR
jgi:hypothetical protein